MARLRSRAKIILFGVLVALTSCAPTPFSFHSLLEKQPFVTEISPSAESKLLAPVEITVKFSERVDISQIKADSVSLLKSLPDDKLLSDASKLVDELQDHELPSVALQYLLSEDETSLTVLPEGELADGVYHLVVTPRLRSTQGLPFNQKPGEAPVAFVARFYLGDVPTVGSPGSENGLGNELPEFGPGPEFLVVNELLYDGLVSETDGESFVELYGTPGADISLYQVAFINGADGAETDRVTLPKGSILGEDGIFVIADLNTNSSTQSHVPHFDFLDHFDPQNGPDGLLLLNREGVLLDSVVYGEGAVAQAGSSHELGEGMPAPDAGNGHSLSRIEGKDTQDNAADFVDLDNPTPGIF